MRLDSQKVALTAKLGERHQPVELPCPAKGDVSMMMAFAEPCAVTRSTVLTLRVP